MFSNFSYSIYTAALVWNSREHAREVLQNKKKGMYFFTKDATCQNRLSDIHLAKNGGRAGSEELFMTCISHGAQTVGM